MSALRSGEYPIALFYILVIWFCNNIKKQKTTKTLHSALHFENHPICLSFSTNFLIAHWDLFISFSKTVCVNKISKFDSSYSTWSRHNNHQTSIYPILISVIVFHHLSTSNKNGAWWNHRIQLQTTKPNSYIIKVRF